VLEIQKNNSRIDSYIQAGGYAKDNSETPTLQGGLKYSFPPHCLIFLDSGLVRGFEAVSTVGYPH